MGRVHIITQESYDYYFNRYTGEIRSNSSINKGDILKIGNISNRGFVISCQLTLMPISSDNQIKEGFIHLIEGSSGSTITGLTINNTKSQLIINGIYVSQLHGIWLTKSNNNTISYNTIRIANGPGVYAMPMGWSCFNKIVYNDMKTYITCNMVMGLCHYNLISQNRLEVLSYSDYSVTNLIYYNPFSHADYDGPALCLGNEISFNYLKGFCTGEMSIILQLTYSNHNNTIIANNTIIKGSYGINLFCDNANVYGNEIYNSLVAININSQNLSVVNNKISGKSLRYGICCVNYGKKGVVKNNTISFTDIECAIKVENNTEVCDNVINIKGYGVGIFVNGDMSKVYNNRIKTYHDNAINFLGNNIIIDNNIINTKAIGISIDSPLNNLQLYNNSITNNKIISESYAIYMEGLIYCTTILNNIIETNATNGIYKKITDESLDDNSDNMVNGIIYNATSLSINDDNFYEYFDIMGHLNYTFKENKTKVIFLTFLTNKNLIFDEKINVISNKRNNLLFNVTLTFIGDASGSLIRDFNFLNFNKEAIILDAVDDVTISNNNITLIITQTTNFNSAILFTNVCENNIIQNNNIYINSKSLFSYSISAPAYNPSSKLYNINFSKGFKILKNTIIMFCEGIAEGIYSDTLVESEICLNKINIISQGICYGIATGNTIGRQYNLNISNNEIVVHSKQMVYLIEIQMSDNVTICSNNLFGDANGIYGITTYDSNNVSISSNELNIFGGNLSKITKNLDILGNGISAIAIFKSTNLTNIHNNLIYTNASNPIIINNTDSIVNLTKNYHIISDYNYQIYVDNNSGQLSSEIIKVGDVILLNLTNNQKLIIDISIDITSYKLNVSSIVCLELKNNSFNIYNLSFINSTLSLNGCFNSFISNNTFNNSSINIIHSFNNYINNDLFLDSTIDLINCSINNIDNNKFICKNIPALISFNNSHDIFIINNFMEGISNSLILINSSNSNNSIVKNNNLIGNASSIFAYWGFNSHHNLIINNKILINGFNKITNQSAILYSGNSSYNKIKNNHIISYSLNADDYAIEIMSDENFFNEIIENYLISSNGYKSANVAVNAIYDLVINNSPYEIYVSEEGSDDFGNGSKSNPYASISFALRNSLNHCIIYLIKGIFVESNLLIDKNITISNINSSKIYIDANSKQLFNITQGSYLTINGLIIQNGYNVDGGSLFINNGVLIINNSMICNSSSFYDNSNPIFIDKVINGNIEYDCTLDCRETGRGGAILNYGDLFINSSEFYGNLAHIGGVIADFGKTTINASIFHDNCGVHGGVIYTNSSNDFLVNNSLFFDNVAITHLNFCMIGRSKSGWTIENGDRFYYYTLCDEPIGHGGVIFTINTRVYLSNSIFNHNSAHCGGVIATLCSFGEFSSYNSKTDLIINNCSFINNKANNTKINQSSIFTNSYQYNTGYNGGVIYGTFKKEEIKDSMFYYNIAVDDGGALYSQAVNGSIDSCILFANRAGKSGGALVLSKNFIITNTIISNNSAYYGGAIDYRSYEYYGHIQYNLNIYNSTITNNFALDKGGVFFIGKSNINVHYSNIYDNIAPEGSTIYGNGGRAYVNMEYNFWGIGSNGKPKSPDNSVWNFPNIKFKPILRQEVIWKPIIKNDEMINNESGSNNENINPIHPISPISTGFGSSTGSKLGGNGNGGGKYPGVNGPTSNRPGSGINLGLGEGGSYGPINNGGDYNFNSTNHQGNDNMGNTGNFPFNQSSSSLSRINSSNFNSDLTSVGLIDNSPSDSKSGGNLFGNSVSKSGSSSKTYEIDKKIVKNEINNFNSIFVPIIFLVICLILLIIGYLRKNKEY